MKIKKKIRIQGFDIEGNQLLDRLVEQEIEFNTGPKEPHNGPLRIEVNLWEQGDIDRFIEYLKKLTGQLPITVGEPKVKTLKAGKVLLAPEQREEIIKQVTALESQDACIKQLRDLGFEFLTFDYISSLGLNTGIEDIHKEKYQWMMKIVKKAKNPLNNKYDPMLVFGFKLIGKKIGTFVIYLYQKKHKVVKKEWVDKQKVSFKNTEMVKFPTYMIQEERDKFRVELYALRLNAEKKPTKFFIRWAKDVEFKDREKLLKRANED
jgi:hypothetical protein